MAVVTRTEKNTAQSITVIIPGNFLLATAAKMAPYEERDILVNVFHNLPVFTSRQQLEKDEMLDKT